MRLAEAEAVFNLETHFSARDRQLRRVLDSSWITRDDAGVVTGYTSHLKDVTYVKNLEARLKISERNYIFLFDSILSSIVIVDPLGRILNCNYSAEKLFGYRWQEIGHLLSLYRGDYQDYVPIMFNYYANGDPNHNAPARFSLQSAQSKYGIHGKSVTPGSLPSCLSSVVTCPR